MWRNSTHALNSIVNALPCPSWQHIKFESAESTVRLWIPEAENMPSASTFGAADCSPHVHVLVVRYDDEMMASAIYLPSIMMHMQSS